MFQWRTRYNTILGILGERETLWGQQMWELLKRETELMKKPYEMRWEKKVENTMKAMEICKSIVPLSMCQRALVPKDILKFQLRKP